MNFTSILSRYVFPFLFSSDVFNPEVSKKFSTKYDYIVVGSGSAGSVVAARLSEDPCVTVLLLEAGPKADVNTEVPLSSTISFYGVNSWLYHTVPQSSGGLGLTDKTFYLPAGKGLGGSSILTSPQYSRGNRRDYDKWSEGGATGWSWEEVFPYFLKSENNTDPEIANNGYHSTKGPLTVQSLQYRSKVSEAFRKAGKEMGYTFQDLNGKKATGFGPYQGPTRFGRRCSTSKAYLVPAQERTNLDIVNNALVTKIIIEDKTATGVKFEIDGEEHTASASKEIILSAGTYNSPQVLMLSGIGKKDHLNDLGIDVVMDLPVGDNLQIHIGSYRPLFEASPPDLFKRVFADPSKVSNDFNHFGKGPLTSFNGFEGIAQINSKGNDPSLDWPDLVIIPVGYSPVSFAAANPDFPSKTINVLDDKGWDNKKDVSSFFFLSGFVRPFSRGTIRLSSSNPKDAPLIDPNVFGDQRDLEKVVEAAQVTVNIVNSKAFKNIGAKLFDTKAPGCEQYVANSTYYSPEYLRCQAVQSPFFFFHPVGTCKMGSLTDKTAVVDPELKVKGIKNLRVVDGSIMPTIVSGGPNAPISMIGEKAADMIKKDNLNRQNC